MVVPELSTKHRQQHSLPEEQFSQHVDNHNNHNARPHRKLARRLSQAPITEPVAPNAIGYGLIAGTLQAGIFNPYDRALYLSIKDKRPFLHRDNWSSPYSGFSQSVGGRALSGGLYFPLEHFFLRMADPVESHTISNFYAGTAAGAVNACMLNPLSAIKYKTWGREVNQGALREALEMLHKSGWSIRPFFNGLIPTVLRDVAFGSVYTTLRLQIQWWCQLEPSQQYIGNFLAAGLATIVSGPFNYVRNVQYGTHSAEKAGTMTEILWDLCYKAQQKTTLSSKLLFLQCKLRIGWGTFRVAIGMTFGHYVYNWLYEHGF